MSATTQAQDQASSDDTTETDPVVDALKREKEISGLKKEIAENQHKELAASLPTSSTTGQSGKADFKANSGYYAEVLAFEALNEVAGTIAERIVKSDGASKLVVTNRMDLAQEGQRWRLIQSRLDNVARGFDTLMGDFPETFNVRSDVQPEAVATALAALPAVLGAAADVVAFFRTDLTITAVSVSVTENALLAAVSEKAKAEGWTVTVPSLGFGQGALVRQLDGLLSRRGEVAGRKDVLRAQIERDLDELARLRSEVIEAKARLQALEKKKPVDTSAVSVQREAVQELEGQAFPLAQIETRWTRLATRFDAHLNGFDALVKALTEGEGGKPSPIESVYAFDLIRSEPKADVLMVEISSQGGEIHVAERSFASAKISYLAGVVCSFFQTSSEGALRASGTVSVPKARAFKVKDLIQGSKTGGP